MLQKQFYSLTLLYSSLRVLFYTHQTLLYILMENYDFSLGFLILEALND